MCQSDEGRLYDSQVRDCVIVHLGLNVSSSAHTVIVGVWSMAVTLWQQFEYYHCTCRKSGMRRGMLMTVLQQYAQEQPVWHSKPGERYTIK